MKITKKLNSATLAFLALSLLAQVNAVQNNEAQDSEYIHHETIRERLNTFKEEQIEQMKNEIRIFSDNNSVIEGLDRLKTQKFDVFIENITQQKRTAPAIEILNKELNEILIRNNDKLEGGLDNAIVSIRDEGEKTVEVRNIVVDDVVYNYLVQLINKDNDFSTALEIINTINSLKTSTTDNIQDILDKSKLSSHIKQLLTNNFTRIEANFKKEINRELSDLLNFQDKQVAALRAATRTNYPYDEISGINHIENFADHMKGKDIKKKIRDSFNKEFKDFNEKEKILLNQDKLSQQDRSKIDSIRNNFINELKKWGTITATAFAGISLDDADDESAYKKVLSVNKYNNNMSNYVKKGIIEAIQNFRDEKQRLDDLIKEPENPANKSGKDSRSDSPDQSHDNSNGNMSDKQKAAEEERRLRYEREAAEETKEMSEAERPEDKRRRLEQVKKLEELEIKQRPLVQKEEKAKQAQAQKEALVTKRKAEKQEIIRQLKDELSKNNKDFLSKEEKQGLITELENSPAAEVIYYRDIYNKYIEEQVKKEEAAQRAQEQQEAQRIEEQRAQRIKEQRAQEQQEAQRIAAEEKKKAEVNRKSDKSTASKTYYQKIGNYMGSWFTNKKQ